MSEIEMYNKAEELTKVYVNDYKDDAQDIETLRHELGDEDFIKVMEDGKGRQILISCKTGNIDDPPINWQYNDLLKIA